MNNNFKNILSDKSEETQQAKLLDYLNNELPSAEQHSFESSLNNDPFLSDALDGLQEYENKKDIPGIVHQLNIGLTNQLAARFKRKKKRVLKAQPWVYYAVIIILLLCILTYFVVKKAGS